MVICGVGVNYAMGSYFSRVEGGYQISKALREMCVFSRHDLIQDPPFSKLDLISCRNVLIFFGSARKNVIALFHYALNPGGFLVLGPSETESGNLFSLVEVVILVAAYLTTLSVRSPELLMSSVSSWHLVQTPSGETLSYAGWWFGLISVPIYRFLLLRWVWRMFLWASSLWRVSRLNLVLIPTLPIWRQASASCRKHN